MLCVGTGTEIKCRNIEVEGGEERGGGGGDKERADKECGVCTCRRYVCASYLQLTIRERIYL